MAAETLNRDHPSRIVVVTQSDRLKAMRQARRHTILVRALRLVLPVCAVALLGSYGLFMQQTISVETRNTAGVFTTGPIVPSFDNLTMMNPKYDGFNQKDGSSYSVTAKKAITDLSPSKPINLVGITGNVRQADGTIIKIEAADGQFDRKTEELQLYNGIRVETSSGLFARLSRATVLPKKGLLTSGDPVDFWMTAGQVRGNTMILRHKEREVVFDRGVAIRLNPPEKKADDKKPVAQKSPGLIDFAATSNQPVNATAATMTVKDQQQTILLTGDVRATQGPASLASRELEITYSRGGASRESKAAGEKGHAAPSGRASSSEPGTTAGAGGLFGGSGSVRKARATGDVVITREGTRVVSHVAHFLAEEKRVLLMGDVVMTSGPDRKVMADQAEIHTETNDAVLTGQRVTLTQGPNVLTGARVTVERAAGRMQLTRPGDRIAAHLVPPKRPQARNAKAKARAEPKAGAASALGGLGGGFEFKTDPNAPLDIDAVVLTVNDKMRTAVFEGKVVARQGGMKIEAPRLTAHYTGGGGLLPAAGRTSETDEKAGGSSRLTRVKATGGVLITSDDGRLAQGTGPISMSPRTS
jgi:hypothetical protein